MRMYHALISLFLFIAIAGYSSAQDKSPEGKSAQQTESTVANPLAYFERLIADEWKVTAQSGKSMFHAWHWGPGKHSIRRMSNGFGAGGDSWRELRVMYWHPGHKKILMLGISPYARGITEGEIKFDGKTADAVMDLYQTGVRRKMGLHWAFDGDNKYRETLLEATGTTGLKPLAEWDHVRTKPPATSRPFHVDGEKPSKHTKVFESLLGHKWDAKGNWATGEDIHTQSTFEWIPIADAIYARVLVPSKDREPTHLLDVYFYHHTGANTLRCLALSEKGGVYEGNITVLDGGSLQFDLKGYEGDLINQHIVRIDHVKEGTLRQRIWSVKGSDRTLILDVNHQRHK